MKKLFFKCFVVMFALCLPLLAQAQLTTPYFEDFEGMATSATPTGWDNSASTTATSLTGGYVWGVYETGGNKMIRMNNYWVNNGVACINTPTITLPATGSCQLAFKYAHTASCGDFKVKISTDNGVTFTDLATYTKGTGTSYSDPGEFTDATISLNSYLGQTAIIQFWTTANYGNGAIFVDDVEVGPEPTCFPPTNLQVSDITADEANFSWTASGHEEVSWEYLCIPATATPDWSNAEPWSMNQVLVDNLTPNTNYKFYIRSYCSPTDQSKAVSVAFKTLCAAVTPEQLGMITFEQGFNYGSGNLNGDNCWYAGSFQATSTSYIPSVNSSSYSAFDGEGYLQMRAMTNAAGTSRNDSAYAILPEINFVGGITNYHMQMRIEKGGKTSTTQTFTDTLFVAQLTDPANPHNFNIIGYAVATSNEDYQLADVSFANASATGNYIMLLASAPKWAATNTKLAQFYIDNIVIKANKLCATPTDIAVSDITPSTVNVSWTGSSDARIMLATEDVTYPDTYTEWAIDTTVSTNPATIDVAPATDYYLYVQCICSDSSEISYAPVLFQSGCDAITSLPWIEDFEEFEGTEDFKKPCWTNVHTEGTATAVAKIEGSRNGTNRTKQLKFDHYGDSGEVVVVTLPEINIPTANAYEFAISAYRTNDAYPELVNDGVYVITENAAGDGFDTLFIPHNIANPGTVGTENHDDWYTYSVVLPKAGVNNITVRHLSEGGLAMYVDNFTVRAIPACAQVRHLTATDVQPRQVSLDWDETGAANYQVVLTTEEINPDTLATVPDSVIVYNDTVAADSAVATGLIPTVVYYAYVRGICGAENGAWAAPVTFRTPCEDYTITATDIYFQGFEGLEDQVRYVPCWDFITYDPTAYATGSKQMIVSATKAGSFEARTGSMLFNYGNPYGAYNGANDTSIMVLPQTTNNVQDLRLKFWFACPVESAGDNSPLYFDTLVVGVITDIADKSTFTPVARFHADQSGVYQLAEAMFDEYTGAQGRIAIQRIPVHYHPSTWVNQYWGSIIDDVTIDLAPSCKKVTEVVASDITEATAKLSWKATNAASYNVIVADAAIDADALDSAAMSHIVTAVSVAEDSVNLVSLQPYTTYYAYIVGDCGNGDLADASAACQFTTYMAAPYFQDFQDVAPAFFMPSEFTQYATNSHVDSLLADGNFETPSVVNTSNYNDWCANNIYAPNYTASINIFGFDLYRMLATPAIVMHGSDSLHLSFDLFKSVWDSTDPADDANNYDDYFYVMLANPEMTSYTMLASWTNDTVGRGDYSLRNDISGTSSNWTLDLSDYEGAYRIIFAAGSSEENDDYRLHLDNIVLTADATLAVVANNDIRGTVTGSTDETFLGAEVEITATPNDDYVFYQWSNGDNNATTTYTVAAKHDTVTAIFLPEFVDFTITSDNEDMGTVTGTGHYAALDTVTISAIANEGFVFSNWSDGSMDAVREIIAMEDLNLVAYFDTIMVNVVAEANDPEFGTVEGAGVYAYGETVQLVAVPADHYHFTAWSNGETTDTINIVVTSDTTLTANFEIDSYTVTVNKTGNGTVEGAGTFEYGTIVTLTATPDDGWEFTKWTMDGVEFTEATLTFTLEGDVTVEAVFSPESAVDNVEAVEYIAYTENMNVVVNGVENHNVALYDVTGRLVKMIDNASETERFSVNAAGVYFIRIDHANTIRVVVK